MEQEQYQVAYRSLSGPAGGRHQVDLHAGPPEGRTDWREVWGRSVRLEVEGVGVRTLGAEDHLRLLCLHFLRHGGWRPLWLCNIGAVMESRPPDFDWDLFFEGSARDAGACASAILLARRILGADLTGTPLEAKADDRPRLPLQVVDAASRLVRFALSVPLALGRRVRRHLAPESAREAWGR